MANNKTDYTKPHTDLVKLLPEPMRSDVNLSLFNNVFNRYLTKQEIEKVAGYIGRGNTAAIRPRQIHEQDVHRQAYQLQPIPYNKIGTIEHMTSWKDMQNELERLGVDMDAFSEWGTTQKFNWVPPIDINKIINYRDYYWVDTVNPNSIPQYITIRSTCATATAKFNFWDSLIEQHGATFQISEILPSDATPLTYTITDFIDTPDSIKIEGDVTSDILLGDFIDVVGSVNNNETYRITATPTYSGVTNETLLAVDKPIIADTPATTALVQSRRFDKLVLPANTTLVGSPPVAVTDLGNYTSLFVEGFIFFVRNSTNTDLNSTFIETISSTYDADKKETTVVINHRVTDDTADGEISLEEQFSILEADMNCQCGNFGGWDVSPWDDNPLEPLWGDSEDEFGAPNTPDGISDHENLIDRISETTPPVSGDGIEGQLWYDTTENILYQNSAVPLTVSRTNNFVVSGSPVGLVFDVDSVISSNTIVTAEIISGSPAPVSLNISYIADGTTTTVTVLDSLSTNDIIAITYETPVWTVVWRNFSLILEQTTGIALWDLSLSCDTRPRIVATEQWISQNKWFHKNDVVNFTSVQRANQPIIEYDWDVELNEWTYVNYNWSYRRIITETFTATIIKPPRIELEPLIWWENTGVDNTIILDDRYGDLTDYFTEGRTVFFLEGLQKLLYTVVSSSYKTADALVTGDEAFPYRTYITFDKTVIGVGSPIITDNLSQLRPNAISIIPALTSQGDTWKDYGVHWLYVGADDAVPAPHPVPNPFMDIDVTQTPTAYPPETPAAGSPIGGSPIGGSPPAPPAPAESSWDISTASFPGATTLTVGFFPSGFCYGDSGNKLYTCQGNSDRIYQYTLSTPYDSSTLVYDNKTITLVGEISQDPLSIEFNPTGTRMFITGNNNSVYTFLLLTPWDITSWQTPFTSNKALDGITPTTGVHFSDDGTKMVSCQLTGTVSTYTLVSAFDPSTMVTPAANSIDLSATDNEWSGVHLSTDGTKMYLTGRQNALLYQYALSPAWDVSTATFTKSIDISFGAAVDVEDVTFNPAGTELYILGSSEMLVYQQTLDVAWTIQDIIISQVEFAQADTSPQGLTFSPDGKELFVAGDTNNKITHYSMTVGWDIANASFTSELGIADTTVMDVLFNPAGTKMYVLGGVGDKVYQYTLGTPWDITGATDDNNSTLITSDQGETTPSGMYIGDDGFKCYIVGQDNDTVYQYTLGTAYDMSTASYATKLKDVTAQVGQDTELVYFKPDGTIMYVATAWNGEIYQYALNTAWDVSSAVYDNKLYQIFNEEGSVTGMTMTDDGLKLFVIGSASDSVREYDINPI